MQPITPLPFYHKLAANLVIIVILSGVLYVSRDIVMPMLFAVVLAVLLLPMNNWLVKKGLPQVPSMLLSILLAILAITLIVYFLSRQVAGFMDDLPRIKHNLQVHLNTVQQWIRENLNISKKQQQEAVSNATKDMKSSGPGMIGTTFLSAAQAMLLLVLIPIYTFLMLYYRQLIRKFLTDVFATRHRSKVEDVLQESRSIIQSYMVGLLLEMGIVAVLNAIGFFIIGIEYAIFLAVLTAILNMIPYIGMVIATLICMAITLTTSNEISPVLWVAVVLFFVQLIDNNFLMPYVVSSKVKINALVSIVGVLIGGALGGVSGMFLSIPGLAIMKAVFDRVDGLQPWGMLLGDDQALDRRTRRHKSGTAKPA
jgi:predicted PurR-regulated permease PerM